MSHPEPDRTHGAMRKLGVTLDRLDTSCFLVRWAIDNYIKRSDVVVLFHVSLTRLTSLNSIMASYCKYYATLLKNAHIPYVIYMVKEQDMKKSEKELVCLELDKLGLDAVIMCSRNTYRDDCVRLGRVSGYCAQNCICPVVLVRPPIKVLKFTMIYIPIEESEDRIIDEQRKKLEAVHSKM